MVEARRRDVVHAVVLGGAREGMGEIYPGTDQNGSSRQGDALVAEGTHDGQDHAAAGRVTGEENGARFLEVEKVQVGGEAVLQAAGEGELRSKAVLGGEDPSLELPGMALHLIAMFADAAEIVRTAMDVKHDAPTRLATLFSLLVV